MKENPLSFVYISEKQKHGKLGTLSPISEFIDIEGWGKYLRDENTAIESKIRANTLAGRPIGSDEFVDRLEKLSGKRLKPMPEGRPPKAVNFLGLEIEKN